MAARIVARSAGPWPVRLAGCLRRSWARKRRPARSAAVSSSPASNRGDSDLYEEFLVNPTLLTLATRRGNIDCGGLRYLIVGYGHFHQLVIPSPAGHLSVAFELSANPADYLQAIVAVMAHHGQPAL